MAFVLYRLGRWSYRHRRAVVAAWLGVLIAVGVAAVALKGSTNDAFSVPGTESQRALNLLNDKFPGTGGATARVVVAAPAGHTLNEARYRTVLAPTIERVREVPQTVKGTGLSQTPPTVSKDQRIAFGDISFTVPVDKLTNRTRAALQRVAEPARKAGLQVEFSGGIVSTGGAAQGITEGIGIAIAFVVLLIAFGALSSVWLPLITAFAGVAIGLLSLTAMTGIVKLSSSAPTLATMLGLAVGIDYALFILSRHRQQMHDGMELEESIGRAVATAGSAVVFAGLTVVIALIGLLITGIPFLAAMGLGAAYTVIVAVAIALTLLPALLGFLGHRALKGKHTTTTTTTTPLGERWAQLVTRRPVASILAVIVLLGVIALPALHLNLGLPDAGTKPKTSTERRAYDLLIRGFGPGFNGPLTVVVDASNDKNYKEVGPAVSKALGNFKDVAAASPATPNATGKVSIISLTPASGPSTQATKNLVTNIRAQAAKAQARYHVDILVTGPTAINLDVSDKLASALPSFIVFIVGLALVLLLLVFRSLLVPIKAVVGFLFTIAAVTGAVVWIFQNGHLASLLGVSTEAPILSFLPVLMIAILFGLAMDYQVFLVTRIREAYVHGETPIPAIRAGFRASARVVTAAALIMISVFSGFIIGDDPVIKSIGFALAFGVLIDAFFIRMTLVPAILALLGRRAWTLPNWLERRLPNLDIEGEHLERQLARSTVAKAAD